MSLRSFVGKARRLIRDGNGSSAVFAAAALIVTAVLTAGVYLRLSFGADDSRYVLSSQAQVMGAVLALAFTMPLVVAQMRVSYGVRGWFRLLWPWGYATAFTQVAATLVPLSLLGVSEPTRSALIPYSLALCTLGVCLLAAFVNHLRRCVSPEALIHELLPLSRRVGDFREVGRGLEQLSQFILISLERRDYIMSKAAIEHLCRAAVLGLSGTYIGEKYPMVATLVDIRNTAERIGADAIGVTQMTDAFRGMCMDAIHNETIDGMDFKEQAAVFVALAEGATRAQSRAAARQVVCAFADISRIHFQCHRYLLFQAGREGMGVAVRAEVWKSLPEVEENWCKWVWVLAATHHVGYPVARAADDGVWKDIKKELEASSARNRNHTIKGYDEALDWLKKFGRRGDPEALQEVGEAWKGLREQTGPNVVGFSWD